MAYDSAWNLIQDYTFPGSSLPAAWTPYTGGQWGTGAGISVSGGVLNLETDSTGTYDAGVQTNASWTYGRWEITATVDQDSHNLTGPAVLLWPVSQAWPLEVEIDIVECQSGTRGFTAQTVHYGNTDISPVYLPNVTEVNSVVFNGSLSHVYAVEWVPDGITFWIDGYPVNQLVGPAALIPQTPHFLGLQFGLNVYTGSPSAATNIGLHVSEVKVFDGSGQPANVPNRFAMAGGTRYRWE